MRGLCCSSSLSAPPRQQVDVGAGNVHVQVGERDALQSAAALGGIAAPGVIDQHAPHGFGGGAEEVPAVLPVGAAVGEAHPGFADQRSGLQSVSDEFKTHLADSHASQFVVDEFDEIVVGVTFARVDAVQQNSDLRRPHAASQTFASPRESIVAQRAVFL